MPLSETEFVARYAGIYERSPWVAEEAAALAIESEDSQRVADIMAECVDNASAERQLALIRAHPDLAGKAQVADELTAESTTEQASAGLDQCSLAEYEQFQALNRDYHDKFGFPFVMAVRDSGRADILAAFERRLGNGRDLEFETALQEIHRIAKLRIETMEPD